MYGVVGYQAKIPNFLAQKYQYALTANLLIIVIPQITGAPNDNFRENICSEDDLRSRIFGAFVVKFLACLPLLGFSNIY